MVQIKVKKIKSNAQIPQFAHPTDACADIYAAEDTCLGQSSIVAISTGIQVEIPEGYEIQVRPRSGLALKNGIGVLNSPGTIDADYRGEIKIILINLGKKPFTITSGDRIAQLAVRPIPEVSFIESTEISETKRGEGGFGSTGINSRLDS